MARGRWTKLKQVAVDLPVQEPLHQTGFSKRTLAKASSNQDDVINQSVTPMALQPWLESRSHVETLRQPRAGDTEHKGTDKCHERLVVMLPSHIDASDGYVSQRGST